MKYIILADAENSEPFKIPRQLSVINGETLIGRTVRLLKQNKIKDIIITSHDTRFDNFGVKRYEPKNNDRRYWVNAFPRELLTEPITFLLGDVYYSEEAIKTIIKSKTDSILFFCSDAKKGYSKDYIKHHDEPFAFKVVDFELFKMHIDICKKMWDEKIAKRNPITWELYRTINGIDINTHKLTENYIAINDITCDVDREIDIKLIEGKLNPKVIKVIALFNFTYEKFDEIKNLKRKDQNKNLRGKIYAGDTFETDVSGAEYLLGDNRLKKRVVDIISITPERRK